MRAESYYEVPVNLDEIMEAFDTEARRHEREAENMAWGLRGLSIEPETVGRHEREAGFAEGVRWAYGYMRTV